MVNANVVTLDTICGGAAHQMFQREMEKVIENILDPNADESKARKITLEVVIRPDRKTAGKCNYILQATSKLAPISPQGSELFVGKKEGKFIAMEHDLRQQALFPQTDTVPFPQPVAAADQGQA